ncbi:hypothetical protein NYG95_06260 [Campylobacter felis]|uniref:Periplasmic protein n=1 Tax=Campylobacter felis TaxID=2974565 RepID=A0ABT7I6D1_9BACT|nr:hypothetical protein [Campylobacter upsaliensis]MDL0103796.1 hypothetical protein [Campylobacter felis]MDL0108615.1 hypothetical protein [Campylobacter felis]MDL0147210.1 hypothetical protein [Campylobacter felis]
MLKKVIVGGIALAATGYGLKKFYEYFASDTSSDDTLGSAEEEARRFNFIQDLLLRVNHFEVINFVFQAEDFISLGIRFKVTMSMNCLDYLQDEFMHLASQKNNFEDFNPREKELFIWFNRLNSIMVSLLEGVKESGVYPKSVDDKLNKYLRQMNLYFSKEKPFIMKLFDDKA